MGASQDLYQLSNIPSSMRAALSTDTGCHISFCCNTIMQVWWNYIYQHHLGSSVTTARCTAPKTQVSWWDVRGSLVRLSLWDTGVLNFLQQYLSYSGFKTHWRNWGSPDCLCPAFPRCSCTRHAIVLLPPGWVEVSFLCYMTTASQSFSIAVLLSLPCQHVNVLISLTLNCPIPSLQVFFSFPPISSLMFWKELHTLIFFHFLLWFPLDRYLDFFQCPKDVLWDIQCP